jgi:predicted nucleic acid-binding Zn ribbon protein
VLQKFSDAPITACPKCGADVRKMMSNSSFHLKGTGWYLTDYAKKNSPKTDSEPKKTDSAPKAEGTTSSSKDSD